MKTKLDSGLTDKGRARMAGSPGRRVAHLSRSAGSEYMISEDGGAHWVPLPNCRAMQPYRHDWVINLSLIHISEPTRPRLI
eukprot:6069152-Amphidinium_carterae.1